MCQLGIVAPWWQPGAYPAQCQYWLFPIQRAKNIFTGSVEGGRHYSTGTIEGNWHCSTCTVEVNRHYSGQPALLNLHYRGTTTTVVKHNVGRILLCSSCYSPPQACKVSVGKKRFGVGNLLVARCLDVLMLMLGRNYLQTRACWNQTTGHTLLF